MVERNVIANSVNVLEGDEQCSCHRAAFAASSVTSVVRSTYGLVLIPGEPTLMTAEGGSQQCAAGHEMGEEDSQKLNKTFRDLEKVQATGRRKGRKKNGNQQPTDITLRGVEKFDEMMKKANGPDPKSCLRDGGLTVNLGRSRSAERRKTSMRFFNIHRWECQQYEVNVSAALGGEKLIEGERFSDLTLVSTIRSEVSGRLEMSHARVGLVFEGRRIHGKEANKTTLYKLGNFRRCLNFEAVVLPPERCIVCRYDAHVIGIMPKGRFVMEGEGPDYRFESDEESEEQVKPSDPWRSLDSDSDGDTTPRGSHWRAEERCFCHLIAYEFGWKDKRAQNRMM